jgi:predicted transcriptional regulator
MHGAVAALSGSQGTAEEEAAVVAEHTPAVGVRKSLSSKDHIISMIDGKPYKTLKRHLSTHGLTPAEYRARYNLKPDYPMVAENYAAFRRETAKKLGLGRKPGTIAPAAKAASPTEAKASAVKPAAKAAAKPASAKAKSTKSPSTKSAAAKPAAVKKTAAPKVAQVEPETKA